jgi:hypothetical protein
MADQGNVVLPKELRLAPPATMPQSRSYMFKQQAALSNYKQRDTIQINLPRLQRSYLTKDSYLEFEVEFTYKPSDNANFLCLDTPGALGLIDRIEVYDYLGSTQLESTAGFGQLLALLHDTHLNASEYSTHQEIVSGGQSVGYVTDWERPSNITDFGTYAAGKNFNCQLNRAVQPNTGEIVDYATFVDPVLGAVALGTARTFRRRYHMPLFSFLGVLSPKYAPLHNGYTIMITLQSNENALIAGGLKVTAGSAAEPAITSVVPTEVSYTVANARMCCQILELGPIAESMLLSTVGANPMIVTTKAYRNYTSTVPANSSNMRLDLNINVASLTNVLWMMRPTSTIGKLEYNSLSLRQRNFLESWYFQYGSSILPQTQGITCFKPTTNDPRTPDFGSEALIELLKARHLFNQPDHKHCFNKYNWAFDNVTRARRLWTLHKNASTPGPDPLFTYANPCAFYERGKFALGLDLELVPGRTNEIICGMNTNGMNTSIFGTFNAQAASQTYSSVAVVVEEVRVDAWCEYDAFVNISPGIASTVSF